MRAFVVSGVVSDLDMRRQLNDRSLGSMRRSWGNSSLARYGRLEESLGGGFLLQKPRQVISKIMDSHEGGSSLSSTQSKPWSIDREVEVVDC